MSQVILIFIYIYIYIYIYHTIYILYILLYIYYTFVLYILYIYYYIYMYVYIYTFLYLYLSIYLSIYLSVYIYIYYIYVYYFIYIYIQFTAEGFFEVATESWSDNPRPLRSLQTLRATELSGHEFNLPSNPNLYNYSIDISLLEFTFHFGHCLRQSSHLL